MLRSCVPPRGDTGLLLLLAGLIGETAGQEAAKPADLRNPFQDSARYVIGPEDTADIRVSRKVLLRPDGVSSIPLLDDVQSAGLNRLRYESRSRTAW